MLNACLAIGCTVAMWNVNAVIVTIKTKYTIQFGLVSYWLKGWH